MRPILLLFSILLFLFVSGCSVLTPDETETYDPKQFPAVPADTPFELSLDVERILEDGKQKLELKLNTTNSTSTPLGLSTYGFSSGAINYQLVVTNTDNELIWEYYKANTIIALEAFIDLEPGETKTFSAIWDYNSNLPLGKYLVYGGFWGMGQYSDTNGRGSRITSFGPVGVGDKPLVLE